MNIAALLSPAVTVSKAGTSTGAAEPGSAFAALFAIGSPDGAVPAVDPALQAAAVPGIALPPESRVILPEVAASLPAVDVPATSAPSAATPKTSERMEMVTSAQPAPVLAAPIDPNPTPPPRLAAALASTALTPVVARVVSKEADTAEEETPSEDDASHDDMAVPIDPTATTPILALLAAVPVSPSPLPSVPAVEMSRVAAQPVTSPPSGAMTPTAPAALPVVETSHPAVAPPSLGTSLPPVTTADPTSAVDVTQPVAATRITSAPRDTQVTVAPLVQPLIQSTDAVPLTSGSALQVFGAAIAAAREPVRRDPTDPATPIAPAAAQPVTPVAVAAVGDTQQVPLDLTHQRWPHAMIERIEQVRDLADAADTRIRLIPDALGTVDVSVRQDGDRLHVHFTAAEPQTRALLQEAQPRLVAAAEERGLKLGGTAVDGGAAGQPQQQQAQQQRSAQPPRAPQRASTTTSEPADDGRLA